jgi:hypothetical protein
MQRWCMLDYAICFMLPTARTSMYFSVQYYYYSCNAELSDRHYLSQHTEREKDTHTRWPIVRKRRKTFQFSLFNQHFSTLLIVCNFVTHMSHTLDLRTFKIKSKKKISISVSQSEPRSTRQCHILKLLKNNIFRSTTTTKQHYILYCLISGDICILLCCRFSVTHFAIADDGFKFVLSQEKAQNEVWAVEILTLTNLTPNKVCVVCENTLKLKLLTFWQAFLAGFLVVLRLWLMAARTRFWCELEGLFSIYSYFHKKCNVSFEKLFSDAQKKTIKAKFLIFSCR